MLAPGGWVTVGIDNGGTANNGTVLDDRGQFLVDTMAELPSLVREGPDKALTALEKEMHGKVVDLLTDDQKAEIKPAAKAKKAAKPAAPATPVTPAGPAPAK